MGCVTIRLVRYMLCGLQVLFEPTFGLSEINHHPDCTGDTFESVEWATASGVLSTHVNARRAAKINPLQNEQ